MTNVSQEIHDFLNKNPFIAKGISHGIVNVRALAFYMLKKLDIDASLHAVMSAIRRYKDNNKKHKESQDVSLIYSDSKISTKSRLMMLTVKRHFNILRNVIPDILDNIHVSKGDVLRIIEGRGSIKFIIDYSKKNEVVKLIPKEELLGINKNLGMVDIHFSEKYGDMPGILAPVLNELAINNINVIEANSSMPELNIIIKEEDISRCHDILLGFFYGGK